MQRKLQNVPEGSLPDAGRYHATHALTTRLWGLAGHSNRIFSNFHRGFSSEPHVRLPSRPDQHRPAAPSHRSPGDRWLRRRAGPHQRARRAKPRLHLASQVRRRQRHRHRLQRRPVRHRQHERLGLHRVTHTLRLQIAPPRHLQAACLVVPQDGQTALLPLVDPCGPYPHGR